MNTYDAEWTVDWPIETGWYWFYGHRSAFAKKQRDAELMVVRVRCMKGGNPYYILDGGFLWPNDGADGVWTPMMVPNTHEHQV